MGRNYNKSDRTSVGRTPNQWTIRAYAKPGDIGYLTYLHGTIYAKEYGYDQTFEAYVAKGLTEFVETFNPDTDRLWLAEIHGHIIGSIAIVRQSNRTAQLRWFLVHPTYRGQGIGKHLLSKALRFCKQKKYKTVSLWTTSDLRVAHHLYTEAGFKKIEDMAHERWGKKIIEERYDLRL
jgi:GNAT superfamily N-acetyltransferase